MRKSLLIMVVSLLFGVTTFAQLSGPKSIPGDYPSVAAAIAELNTQGVGEGGVTFNIAAGYTETFLNSTTGLITATGTASSPIVFQKSGVGNNPLITAGVGTSAGTGALALDGIIVITGGDYITFDGINLTDNPANLDATTRMEIGFGLVKASKTAPVNGCQYVTIKNCSVTLNKYTTTTTITSGIYAGNHVYTDQVNITFTAATDILSNCKFYNNTISTVSNGIKIQGFNTTFDLYDQNNEIGVNGANIITDFTTYAIHARYQANLKVANNSISTTAAAITNQQIYGIFVQNTQGCDAYNNAVTLQPSAGNSGLNGINLYVGDANYTGNVYGNVVQNCTNAAATSAAFNGIVVSSPATILNFYSNIVRNNSFPGTGAFLGISSGSVTNLNMYNNEVSGNVRTGTTGTGSFTCISAAASSTSSVHHNNIFSNYSNQAATLQGGAVVGISSSNGNPANIYNNNIYDLSSGGPGPLVACQGILINSGTQVNVYNNYISDLRAPAGTNTGSIISGIATTTQPIAVNLYFNTVFLNAVSSAANFFTSAFFTTINPVVDLRNNVFVNLSTPNGTGVAAAFRRALPSIDSYSMLSNNNCFYAGDIEDANHAVFYHGDLQSAVPPIPAKAFTFDEFQAFVGPSRESGSFRHLPPFINMGTAPFDLHLIDGFPTPCESGGIQITSPVNITTDFDGNLRSSAPDIGADEFNGYPIGVINPGGVTPVTISSHQINVGFTANPSNNDVVIVWNTTGIFSVPSGTPPAVGAAFAGGTILSVGTSAPVSHTGLTGAIAYYYKAFSYDGSGYSLGVAVFASTNIAPPSGFTATPLTPTQMTLAWTKNAFNNDVIIASNLSDNFGQPVNGAVYSAGNALPTAGTVIYVGPLSGFIHSGLIPNITTYYYKAWSYDPTNNDIYSPTGVTANAATLCSTATIPFFESFEYNGIVGCGTVLNVDNNIYTWIPNFGFAKSGQISLRMDGNINSYGNDWYFTNGLELTAGVTYQVKFWYRNQNVNGNSHQLEVKWGNEPTVAGMQANPAIYYNTTLPRTTTYTQLTLTSFTPSTTGIYYVGWHDFTPAALAAGSHLYMDDITVTTVAPAPPTALSALADVDHINLAYTKNAAGNDVIIATNGTATFDQPVNGTVYPVGTVIGSNGTVIYKGPMSSFIHSGLLPLTTYYYKVWSVNGINAYSATGATADATTSDFQKVCAPIGWSAISSYNVPENPAIESVLAAISSKMEIIISMTNGFYWPSQNLNLIGNWNSNEGYKIKMNEPACFAITGNMVENKTVTLNQGVTFMPVLCSQPVNANSIYDQLGNKLQFAYDFYTQNIYWPEGGLNTLTVFQPGFAYLVRMYQTGEATFNCDKSGAINYVAAQPVVYENAPWSYNASGTQHFISISKSAFAELEKGDFIGVFNNNGVCAGFTQYNGETGNILLVAYGDDITTQAIDGLVDGEGMSFRVFSAAQATEKELAVSFDSSLPNTGSFTDMGLSMILKMGAGAAAINENVLTDITLHPNPSTGTFTLELPSMNQRINIQVENNEGKIIYSEQIDYSGNSRSHQIGLNKVKPGVYFVRISSNSQTVVKKVVVL